MKFQIMFPWKLPTNWLHIWEVICNAYFMVPWPITMSLLSNEIKIQAYHFNSLYNSLEPADWINTWEQKRSASSKSSWHSVFLKPFWRVILGYNGFKKQSLFSPFQSAKTSKLPEDKRHKKNRADLELRVRAVWDLIGIFFPFWKETWFDSNQKLWYRHSEKISSAQDDNFS